MSAPRPSLMDYQAAQEPSGQASASSKRAKTPTTEELIQTSFRLPRSRWKRLQELSIDQRCSVQAILVSALEGEFAKRGLKF